MLDFYIALFSQNLRIVVRVKLGLRSRIHRLRVRKVRLNRLSVNCNQSLDIQL